MTGGRGGQAHGGGRHRPPPLHDRPPSTDTRRGSTARRRTRILNDGPVFMTPPLFMEGWGPDPGAGPDLSAWAPQVTGPQVTGLGGRTSPARSQIVITRPGGHGQGGRG